MKLETLLVDDDEIILYLHNTLARKSGWIPETVSCENGKVAFDYLISHDGENTTFLLLLDINMPVLNGWELLDIINEHKFLSQIYVVMVTSSINTADQEKAKQYAQVIDFQIKPLTIDFLSNLKQVKELKQFFS